MIENIEFVKIYYKQCLLILTTKVIYYIFNKDIFYKRIRINIYFILIY